VVSEDAGGAMADGSLPLPAATPELLAAVSDDGRAACRPVSGLASDVVRTSIPIAFPCREAQWPMIGIDAHESCAIELAYRCGGSAGIDSHPKIRGRGISPASRFTLVRIADKGTCTARESRGGCRAAQVNQG
jgi:hypothetical protein